MFDEIKFRSQITVLPQKGKLALALLICVRGMPFLEKFCADNRLPVDIFNECINVCWTYMLKNEIDNNIEDMIKHCTMQTPDTEKYTHALMSFALNEVISLIELCKYVTDKNDDHIVEVANLSYETIFMLVENRETVAPASLGLEYLNRHPSVLGELHRQVDDINFIVSLKDLPEYNQYLAIFERSKFLN